MKTDYLDRGIELEFIREFSVGGLHLGSGLTSDDRRERIRIAIFTNKLDKKAFRQSGLTYADAYRECYGRSIEMRRMSRDQPIPSHVEEPDDDLDDDDSNGT
jgi:hypothetical protein